jgi:hypothetical protein
MADTANHFFLPYVQPGVAANIPDQATDRLTVDQAAVISLAVKLVVNSEPPVEKTARLYGPGDITGIDPQQVIRIEPRHRTTDFEPNYFPAIEFDRPDFPWLFAPAKAGDQGRLRPWLCLIVVRKQEGVELRSASDQPLPVLEIKAPARPNDELPDLSESHFWSHAQITGADKRQLKTILESDPARTVSRLLCPRRLDPTTDYIACVVPTFEVGRKAGLNESADEQTLAPAWLSGSEAPDQITLPVYYSWEFRTGAGGDFEELVRRLEPRELPAEVGKRPMEISHPGFAMPQSVPGTTLESAPGTTLGLEGALRVVDSKPDEWPDNVRVPFQTALAKILNTPWRLTRGDSDEIPIVAPPIYGCWHAAIREVGTRTTPPPPIWLDELNLDPRNRVTAAMGTQVIQKQQEQLMASAWEQLGDIQKINQRLRQAQLSRAINDQYHAKTFSRFSEEALIRVVAPAQSRVVLEEHAPDQPPGTPPVKTLLIQKLARSLVPLTAVSAPLRKVARPRGAINRQYAQAGTAGIQKVIAFFQIGVATLPGPTTQNRGAVTIDAVSSAVSDAVQKQGGFIWNPNPPGHWERPRVELTQMFSTFRVGSLGSSVIDTKQPSPSTPFFDAVKDHQAYLTSLFDVVSPTPFRPIHVVLSGQLRARDLATSDIAKTRESLEILHDDVNKVVPTQDTIVDIKLAVLVSLNPAKTVSQAVLGEVNINSPPLLTGDDLDPIMDAPTFRQPMYEALRDLSQDYLFPGLEYVPPNTVSLLATNARFIESFIVGLNTEMGRELLWRNYPTDQRGTYFQQFWDTAAADAEKQLDITTPIHQWGDRALGTTAVGAGGDKLVLLIRGELLRRYPGTIIYALHSTDPTSDAGTIAEVHPVFRGTLEPDVTFLGFDLTPEKLRTEQNWFFVLQEQPTEPRFGLDDAPFSEGKPVPELKTWNDLNWGHVAPSADKLKELSYVPVNNTQLTPTTLDRGSWGRNSAHMAYISKQLPTRIAIRTKELLP